MAFQVRPPAGDPRAYAPNRDVAYLFQPAMQQVAAWIEDGSLPVLAEFMKKQGIEPAAIGTACAKMCQCMGDGSRPEFKKETCVESLARSGFIEEPVEAQLAVLAALGAVFVGVTHKGLREATLDGVGPMQSIGELLSDSERLLAKFAGSTEGKAGDA